MLLSSLQILPSMVTVEKGPLLGTTNALTTLPRVVIGKDATGTMDITLVLNGYMDLGKSFNL